MFSSKSIVISNTHILFPIPLPRDFQPGRAQSIIFHYYLRNIFKHCRLKRFNKPKSKSALNRNVAETFERKIRKWWANSRSSSSWHLTTAKNATSVATNSSKVLESADRIMSKLQTCGVSGAEEKALEFSVFS